MRFRGENIGALPPYRIARMGMGFRGGRPARLGELTVWRISTPAAAARNGAPQWTPKSCSGCFRSRRDAGRPGAQISGGEQKMLTVSRTLTGNPYFSFLISLWRALRPSSSSRWRT